MVRAVLQRCLSSSVTVSGNVVGAIGPGVCVLVGIAETDTPKDLDDMANKIINIRMWPNESGSQSWARSVASIGGEVLLVSQFTLCQTLKGNKPDFHRAMKTEKARVAFDSFVQMVGNKYDASKVRTGAFGEMMEVNIVNDGPVTLVLDYPQIKEAASTPTTPISPPETKKSTGTKSEHEDALQPGGADETTT